MVAIIIRTRSNIYILNETGKEKCCMGKEYESWILHRILGHIQYGNIMNISKKEIVRNILEITNPLNNMCKDSQHGKQARVELKNK